MFDTSRPNNNGSAGGLAALVIEDNRDLAAYFRRVLDDAGFHVTVAGSAHGGIGAARERNYSAIVLDIRLPDVDGMEVLAALRSTQPHAHIVIVSGHLTVKLAVDAIKRGASNVLEKPVYGADLVAALASPISTWNGHILRAEVKAAHPRELNSSISDAAVSIAHRWALYVHRASLANTDPRTLELWAKCAAASSTMICESCRMLEIKPHDARDLARALYAMLHGVQWKCLPAVLLDVADSRTLRAFERRAGPWFQATEHINNLNSFLDTQSFVDPQNPGTVVLRRLLGNGRGLRN